MSGRSTTRWRPCTFRVVASLNLIVNTNGNTKIKIDNFTFEKICCKHLTICQQNFDCKGKENSSEIFLTSKVLKVIKLQD